MSNFADVGEFHQKFGLHDVIWQSDPGPTEITPELLDFRIRFLKEELQEFIDGSEAMDHIQMADALIDLVYVAMGTAHFFGYPWQALWNDVQRANMAKERAAGDGSNSARRSSWDVIKPEGWKPPQTEQVLRNHGFKL
jgi:predicted HAD superfamily Cof-like phosphohydrolase